MGFFIPIEILVCSAYCIYSFLLRDVCVQAGDIKGNKESFLWEFCRFNKINKVCCVLEIGLP